MYYELCVIDSRGMIVTTEKFILLKAARVIAEWWRGVKPIEYGDYGFAPSEVGYSVKIIDGYTGRQI